MNFAIEMKEGDKKKVGNKIRKPSRSLAAHAVLLVYSKNISPTITDDGSASNDGTMTNMLSTDIETDVP